MFKVLACMTLTGVHPQNMYAVPSQRAITDANLNKLEVVCCNEFVFIPGAFQRAVVLCIRNIMSMVATYLLGQIGNS